MRTAARPRFSLPLRVSVVMLDLDGTLVDTAPDIAAGVNRMLRDVGMPVYPEATIVKWIGNGTQRLVKRALTGRMDAEPAPTLYERAYPRFLAHYGQLLTRQSRPFPGVVDGLKALKRAGYRLVCVTNKAEIFTLPLLRQLDLLDYFDLVLSGDSLPRQKPDPLPLLHACAHFNAPPGHSVLVGDSSNDTQAARAAGAPVICVAYGYNHGGDVGALRADATIANLGELPGHLRLYSANQSHEAHNDEME